MTGETARQLWPSARPPAAPEHFAWDLESVAELPVVRAEVRAHILGVDGVLGVHDLHAWTITSGLPVLSAHFVVTDEATPPTPAVDRDPSEGGLGLYLIAELATDHGWYVTAGAKHVWAVLAP